MNTSSREHNIAPLVGVGLEEDRPEKWNLRLNRRELIEIDNSSITWNLMCSKS